MMAGRDRLGGATATMNPSSTRYRGSAPALPPSTSLVRNLLRTRAITTTSAQLLAAVDVQRLAGEECVRHGERTPLCDGVDCSDSSDGVPGGNESAK